MTTLTLRYGEDPTTGLPRLEDRSGSLSRSSLEVLRREIDRQFERLAAGPDGQLLAVGAAGLPRHFRVTVTERGRRCPTLLLEATEPPPEADAPEDSAEDSPPGSALAAPGHWQGQFLAETAELLAALSGGARSPLNFVLADLRALLRKEPRKVALLLLAGYLHVGDALSRKHGEPGESRYAQAARDLARLAGDALPPGTLDALLNPTVAGEDIPLVPEEPTGWLRRFFSFS